MNNSVLTRQKDNISDTVCNAGVQTTDFNLKKTCNYEYLF